MVVVIRTQLENGIKSGGTVVCIYVSPGLNSLPGSCVSTFFETALIQTWNYTTNIVTGFFWLDLTWKCIYYIFFIDILKVGRKLTIPILCKKKPQIIGAGSKTIMIVKSVHFKKTVVQSSFLSKLWYFSIQQQQHVPQF